MSDLNAENIDVQSHTTYWNLQMLLGSDLEFKIQNKPTARQWGRQRSTGHNVEMSNEQAAD